LINTGSIADTKGPAATSLANQQVNCRTGP